MYSCDDVLFVCRSIKHYFLMDLGDFFVQFMDLSEDEMKKNMDGILSIYCLISDHCQCLFWSCYCFHST